MDGDARSFPCASPLLAEAEAFRLASLWASGFNSGLIVIESDCKRILDAIVDPSLPCVGHGAQTLIQVRDIVISLPPILIFRLSLFAEKVIESLIGLLLSSS